MIAASGIALGGIFLVLAFAQYDPEQFANALANFNRRDLVIAVSCYWAALGLRVVRWHLLLKQFQSIPVSAVAEALLVGYAANNVIPARLGELVRADYAKARMRISRSTLLGSIVVERVLDLTMILGFFAYGLIAAMAIIERTQLTLFKLIFANAIIVLAVVWFVIRFIKRRGSNQSSSHWNRVFRDLSVGFGALNPRSVGLAMMLSAGIWAGELAALFFIFIALGVSLSLAQLTLLSGVASLSTLIPTAPGYLGSYQLVFAYTLQAFAASETLGLAASVLVQTGLFGSVTVVGIVLYFVRMFRDLKSGHHPTKISSREHANG